jgi:hypothetical protein
LKEPKLTTGTRLCRFDDEDDEDDDEDDEDDGDEVS